MVGRWVLGDGGTISIMDLLACPVEHLPILPRSHADISGCARLTGYLADISGCARLTGYLADISDDERDALVDVFIQ